MVKEINFFEMMFIMFVFVKGEYNVWIFIFNEEVLFVGYLMFGIVYVIWEELKEKDIEEFIFYYKVGFMFVIYDE